jgi:hypothetical protein
MLTTAASSLLYREEPQAVRESGKFQVSRVQLGETSDEYGIEILAFSQD